MLQLQPDKVKSTDEIRAEIAQQLQRLDDYTVRVVSGFVEKLIDYYERTDKTQGAS